MNRLARYAWFVLGWNLLVILWGAWVRITGSGAGCGSHWPLCNGEVLPRAPSSQTWIEFSHRLTSGIDGLLVLGLLIAVFLRRPSRHPARQAAVLSFVFLLIEAAIGAGLVKFELVADNASQARAFVLCAHLVNTLLLIGALTRTAWHLGDRQPLRAVTAASWVSAARLGLVLVVITGGIAALGDTLFPARSLAEGFAQDVDPLAPWLLRLRIFHPVAAVLGGIGLLAAAAFARRTVPSPKVLRWTALVGVGVGVQLVAGAVNVLLLAPGWLQLLHLLLADLLWIGAVVLGLELRASPVGVRPTPRASSGALSASPAS